MGATTLLTLTLIIFLTFTTNGVSAGRATFVADEPPAVLDSAGNELQEDEYYYLTPILDLKPLFQPAIVPAIFRPGTVWLQLEIELIIYKITGLPVKFSPVEPTDNKTILESTHLNIKYTDELSPVSGGSSVWQVRGWFVGRFVTLGGSEEDRKSWFKIEKVLGKGAHVYKLVSSSNSKVDRNIGILNRTYGAKRLALARKPLEFSFVPASNATSAVE